nr:hypothetical protein [Pseudomonas lurida]
MVDGKFIDEDAVAGTPGSLIPSAWGNAVTQEILKVIQEAGLEPDEDDNTQLNAAIDQKIAGASVSFASQPEAEAGESTTKVMSPLRVFQAIAKVVTQATEGVFGWLKIATQTQVNAGADDAAAVTSKKLSFALQGQVHTAFATGGSATTLTLTPTPPIAGYALNQRFSLMFNVGSGLNPTLNVSAKGGKFLKQYDSSGNKVAAVFFAGQVADAIYDGTDFVLQNPLPTAARAHGQCRLNKVGANLTLSPLNGNGLIINGVSQTIPSAGVSLASAGLPTPATLYVYAYMASGVMTLEASITGHSTDASNGVEIKTGDATRTLVGMARTIAGPAFQDDTSQRFVLSYFNRIDLTSSKPFVSTYSTGAASYTELSSSARCEYLSWGNEQIKMLFNGSLTSQAAGTSLMYVALSLDAGSTPEDGSIICSTTIGQFTIPVTPSSSPFVSEGYHFTTILGKCTNGQVLNCIGGASGPDRCVLKTTVRG